MEEYELQDGGAILTIDASGRIGGICLDRGGSTRGTLLARGLLKACGNDVWREAIIERMREEEMKDG